MTDASPEAVVATIEKVEVAKQGTNQKTGRPWTLFKVTAGGQVYTTFDADWQKAVGQERTIEYNTVPSADGKYQNRRIVDPKPQGKGNPAWGRMEEKLDRALELLEKLTGGRR